MIILPPPHIALDNITTQIKPKIEYFDVSSSSTRLLGDNNIDEKTFYFNFYLRNKLTSTQFEIKDNYNESNSTWDDFIDEDFDIVSKFTFSDSFKVKAKIKTISKFVPKIVID